MAYAGYIKSTAISLHGKHVPVIREDIIKLKAGGNIRRKIICW